MITEAASKKAREEYEAAKAKKADYNREVFDSTRLAMENAQE